MLSTKVILLNVTNLSDARYAAGMGVTSIGFSVNPSSGHYVTADDANAISNWLSGISLIGNIGSSIVDHKGYNVDYLLTDNLDLADSLDEPIISLQVNNENIQEVEKILERLRNKVSYFILKIEEGEIKNLLDSLKALNKANECFISTRFDENSLKDVLATNPSGIVLYGSEEEKPGLSNYDGIADVLEMLDE